MSVALEPPFDEVEGETSLQTAINYAVNNHVVVVAGAGNKGGQPGHGDQDPLPEPARLNNVIAVGAHDYCSGIPSWSEFHPTQLDLVAPGFDIRVTTPQTTTAADTG